MGPTFSLLEGADVASGVEQLTGAVLRALGGAAGGIEILDLSEIHRKIPVSQINDIRLHVFKQLNSNVGEYDLILKKIAGEPLQNILGRDLLIQTKLNISIQLPGDPTSTLDLHSDCWSGDTPFQVNSWIPLTPCFSSNSMFILSETKSFNCIRLVNESPTVNRRLLFDQVTDDDFLTLSWGQAIIFNPGLIHGNVINQTDQTRVSINVRFKNAFSPDAGIEYISRSAGPYYRIFELSEWTKMALRISAVNQPAEI